MQVSTHAVPMIIGEIRRYLRDNNPVRVSRSLRDIAYKALQVRERLVAEKSREPSLGTPTSWDCPRKKWCLPWMPSRADFTV